MTEPSAPADATERLEQLFPEAIHPVLPELQSLFHPTWLEHRREDLLAILDDAASGDWRPPVAIELGSHRAAFLEGVAARFPDDQVLGIEIRPKYHRLASERVEARHLDNVRLLCADAKLAVPLLIPLASLEEIHVNFPDPWWKTRHAQRRLLDATYLRVLARRLRPGGRIYLKSDVFDYLHAVRLFAEQTNALRPLPPELWPDERSWTWTTRERKCMRGAIPFGRGYYQRRRDFDGALPASPDPIASDWTDRMESFGVIRGKPPVDLEAQRLTAIAARARAEDPAAPEDLGGGTLGGDVTAADE